MTLRKKLTVSTIAATVAMSAFAGIPLSSKGLAEKLGVSGIAYAAASESNYSAFVEEANSIYAELSVDDVATVNAFRAEVWSVLDASDGDIVIPLVSKITGEESPGELTPQIADLLEALLTLDITDEWQSDYESIRSQYSGLLNEIYPGLTVDDLADVLLDMEVRLAGIVADMEIEDLFDLSAVKDELKAAADVSIASNSNVAALADQADITSQDLVDVYTGLLNGSSDMYAKAYPALIALYNAYLRAQTDDSGSGGDGDGGGTVVVTTPADDVDLPEDATAAGEKLDEAKDKIAAAVGAEKEALIKEAVKTAQEAIDKLTKVMPTVVSSEGEAVANLDEDAVIGAINGIKSVIAKLGDATGGATVDAPKLTLDLGELDVDNLSVEVSDAIVAAAKGANLDSLTVKSGDLSVELPLDDAVNGKMEFAVKQAAPSAFPGLGSISAFSNVVNFNLSVGGRPVTDFDNLVPVSIPVSSTSGGTGDNTGDHLTLFKVDDNGNKLENVGGVFVSGTGLGTGSGSGLGGGVFIGHRDSFSSYVVVENNVTFEDTADVEAWAGYSIGVVAAKGAIDGKAEGVFAPNDNVTRAEFAKMLLRGLDLDNKNAVEHFADVDASDWYAAYVGQAAELGIINGRTATEFDPNATITRAEMATMIARALKASAGAEEVADVDAALAGFTDAAAINATLEAGVAFAASNDLVNGYEDGSFGPNDSATRAEAAVMIYRAIKFN
ncbi:S-layer homology domain-containing protein [Paenibacillus sp. HB172176]|uniref:S-layer homology domain-containing protein n=1 Tax=Paenibacillus sp. HB172176 TaxID=2493690 RepID=UPI00143AECF5|nr:S-layer homology domain-containing protein [Paenibacillus sp. HB172176]